MVTQKWATFGAPYTLGTGACEKHGRQNRQENHSTRKPNPERPAKKNNEREKTAGKSSRRAVRPVCP